MEPLIPKTIELKSERQRLFPDISESFVVKRLPYSLIITTRSVIRNSLI